MISSKLSDRFVARASRAVVGLRRRQRLATRTTEVTAGATAAAGSSPGPRSSARRWRSTRCGFVLKPGTRVRRGVRHVPRRLDRLLLHDQRRPQLLPVRAASSPGGGRPTTPRTAAARPATSSTATPPARRSARAGARAPSCDGRRACCNQFRYGQCHQEISCYGPVVCRVATCTPPWQYDPSCTTTSATDNATLSHGAPCLSDDCISDIERLYRTMGGADGTLGPVVTSRARGVRGHRPVRQVPERLHLPALRRQRARGPRQRVEEVLGAAARTVASSATRRRTSPAVSDGSGYYNKFENGVIYVGPGGTHAVAGGFRDKLGSIGGALGPLGYPTSGSRETAGGVGRYQLFQSGSMWFSWGTGVHWLKGAISTKYREFGGATQRARLPHHRHRRHRGRRPQPVREGRASTARAEPAPAP